jgi:hypothetical protein
MFMEITAVHSKNYRKSINTLCGQHSELPVIKAGGTYSHHYVLRS